VTDALALPDSVESPLLVHGDCIDVLARLPAESVDVVITDPPAGVGFMGKPWDSFANYEPRTARGRDASGRLAGLLAPWAVGFVAFMADVWSEVDRVLKPGGFVCAWALPKTADLAGLALRATGWEIHDSLLHLSGEGMSKAGDLGKKIDAMLGAEREVVGSKLGLPGYSLAASKGASVYQGCIGGTGDPERECMLTAPSTPEAERWTDWSSQLAPGHEQWLLARKPTRLTYARQVLTHGCGAMNIGACRVPRGDKARFPAGVVSQTESVYGGGEGRYGDRPRGDDAHPSGSSGSTGVACVAEQARFVGVERDADSFEVCRARILAATGSPVAAAEANEAAPTGGQLALL